jgi:arylsulfatase
VGLEVMQLMQGVIAMMQRAWVAALLLWVHSAVPGDIAAGEMPPSPSSRPNVILICIDALRADHLGVYGYARPTSPHIDRFAAESWRFAHALAPSSYTRESIAALFMARYPSRTPWSSGWSASPPAGAAVLPKWFQKAGYHTALFSNTPMLEDLTFHEGFDVAECLVTAYGLSGMDAALSARTLAHLDSVGEEPFFLYLHYLDPHGPYRPALPFLKRMGGPRTDSPLALYEAVRGELPQRLAEGFGPGDIRFQDLIDRYDAEIAMVDEAVGQLLEGLEARGLTGNTIVVLFADHGEEFLEHGFVEHAWRVFRESVHVPLLVRFPGQLTPAVHPWPVSLVDIGPTVGVLAGVEAPNETPLDGEVLVRREGGGWVAQRRAAPIISELNIQTRNVVRALHAGDFVYMAAQRWLDAEACSAVALSHREQVRAFERGELAPTRHADPFIWEALYTFPGPQVDDLLRAEPEVAARLRAALRAYLAGCPEPLPEPERMKQRGQREDAALIEERLEALGYLNATP